MDPNEVREVGIVSLVKEAFGFIKCAQRDARVFFHFSESLDPAWEPKSVVVVFSFLMHTSKKKRERESGKKKKKKKKNPG